ncbi:complement factor D [Chanos chanos]|uniref:trypsin n=1 Tax=Chanos chanos TaxID=29144 RepID=A0A6J2V620_CHACN|nr:complement factor D-like [Chanos chanos]
MDSVKLLFASTILCLWIITGESIMNGDEAAPHSRPYMASIQKNGNHECGGFLIASQWVMSASHCFQDGVGGRKIVLGAHSLSADEDTKQTFDIVAVYNHPDFNKAIYDNDISLAKLSRPAVETDAVKQLKYAREGAADPQEDAEVETAGWGFTDNLGSKPDKLQELSIAVVGRHICGRSRSYGPNFTKNMICANKRGQDTCAGDSGGPLLYKGIAVGITSNGGKCGSSRKPGLYTIISHYTQWIDQTMTQ